MKNVTLILNEKEADALVKLLDITLKSSGYAAKDAVYFIDKIIADFNKKEEVIEEVEHINEL
jgi:hypothetical protein